MKESREYICEMESRDDNTEKKGREVRQRQRQRGQR